MSSPAAEGWQRAVQSVRGFARAPRLERCELCSEPLPHSHQHLIDPKSRRLICSCDGCSVLFDVGGVTKYRRVPRVIERLADFRLDDGDWGKLLVPISLAFFYRSSHLGGKTVALYPSPAGVTEADVEPASWEPIVRANPRLAELRDDVEALLINRLRESRDYYVAPIDRCFELVGLVRAHWKGINGGDQVWTEVTRFFERLKESALC